MIGRSVPSWGRRGFWVPARSLVVSCACFGALCGVVELALCGVVNLMNSLCESSWAAPVSFLAPLGCRLAASFFRSFRGRTFRPKRQDASHRRRE